MAKQKYRDFSNFPEGFFLRRLFTPIMKRTLLLIAVAVSLAPGLLRAQNAELDEYVAVSAALAQDNLDSAKTAAGKLAQEKGALSAPASQVAEAASLDAARESFRTLSAAAEKLASDQPGYYVFRCPMAGADWVQKSKDVQNPYMGKQMSSCGSIKDSTAPMKMGGCCG